MTNVLSHQPEEIMKVVLTCCEGEDRYGLCLKERCPLYAQAERTVQRTWPYVGTGFGNLYGNPTHDHFLSAVRKALLEQQPPDHPSEHGS